MKAVQKLALSALLGLASSHASAVAWGQPDGEDHPNVVTLLFIQNGVGFFSCSGTLLTPHVVLTAGHCTAGAGEPNDLTFVRNDSDLDSAVENELFGAWGGDLGDWLSSAWVLGYAVPHPDFDDYAAFPDTYDIGLVLLSEPIFVAEYGAMPALNQFDYPHSARGANARHRAAVVGYGRQGPIAAFAQDGWVRYQGLSAVARADPAIGAAGRQNFRFTYNIRNGNGDGPAGTCSRDSGGPAFWIDPDTGNETNIVMAVKSYSPRRNCNGTDYQFRTDTPEAQNFVNQWIEWQP